MDRRHCPFHGRRVLESRPLPLRLVRARADAPRAVAFAADALRSRRYDVVFVGSELLRGALDQMRRFADKRLSLTDCASFEILERLGLDGAFTFDRDFRDCGYRMLP